MDDVARRSAERERLKMCSSAAPSRDSAVPRRQHSQAASPSPSNQRTLVRGCIEDKLGECTFAEVYLEPEYYINPPIPKRHTQKPNEENTTNKHTHTHTLQ